MLKMTKHELCMVRTIPVGREIAEIRKRLEMTQKDFAILMGVSIHAVQAWEQEKTEPTGSAGVLLKKFSQAPEKTKRFLLAAA